MTFGQNVERGSQNPRRHPLTLWKVFLHGAHIYLGHPRKKKANEDESNGMFKIFWRVEETHKKGGTDMQTK